MLPMPPAPEPDAPRASDPDALDPERDRIAREEEKVLDRVVRTLAARRFEKKNDGVDYDAELIALRDQINEARLEDVPPLIEEMERLQGVAARRAMVSEGHVDAKSPYFGRLVLEENGKKREVLIGRGTYLDGPTGIRIVDWRDAPVSRVYYRYDEGDDYEESFGGRNVEGEVVTRRSLAIMEGVLKRIGSPQGTFLRDANGHWRRAGASATRLAGGQGAAMRPEGHHKPGKLGVGEANDREDKFLPEIAALIDPHQFELISRPTSGLVVIQGGAGSGKTTIGLHRLAYLAFQDAKRFRADRMLVVVYNDALARYISRVLPALGVAGVLVTTYERWAHKQRVTHVRGLPTSYTEDTPGVVVRLKKHPAMLKIIDQEVARIAERLDREIKAELGKHPGAARLGAAFHEARNLPPVRRADIVLRFIKGDEGQRLELSARHALERVANDVRREARDVITAWSELLTDRSLLGESFARLAPGAFTDAELDEAHRWCTSRCAQVLAHREALEHEVPVEPTETDKEEADELDDRNVGVDGVEEREEAGLDHEDDTLFLRLVQRMRGELGRRNEALVYEHAFIDEAQDLSPVELAVVLDTISPQKSVTLAGDLAQRLHLDNGFTDWRDVLDQLGLATVEVEPLKLTYRSTHEIIELADEVLGPLRNAEPSKATRHGAPVELFQFAHSGDAVGMLGEALRELAQMEPRASIAVITRYPEQADLYYKGLVTSEVPNLRRIADQDFPFKSGVDVTDVRQVKGLEFDYVVIVECSSASYPTDDESRHLLHIAATRAAHQLWIISTGAPSPLLPQAIRERAY